MICPPGTAKDISRSELNCGLGMSWNVLECLGMSWNVLDGFTGLPQPTFFNVGLIRLSQALVIGVCGGDSPFMLFDHINYKMSPKYVKCYNTAITPAKQLYYL